MFKQMQVSRIPTWMVIALVAAALVVLAVLATHSLPSGGGVPLAWSYGQ